MKYEIIQPRPGFLVIKELEEEKSGLKKAGQSESKAYGKVVAVPEGSDFEIGQTVVYNEFEGQELMKYKQVTEDGVIIIKDENILAIVQWD